MPPRSTPFLEKQIETLLELHVPMRKITEMTDPPVSYTKVRKVKRSLMHWNTARPPPLVTQGRTPKITNAIGQALETLLLDRPSSYVDEMVWFVWDEFEVVVSEVTMRRWMRKKKYTKKLLSKRALERSQELRDHWMERVQHWHVEQVVCVDESAANERTPDRKYGWAPIGSTPVEDVPTVRSKRWSILPAYTLDGYLSYELFQGSFTAERFNNFVRNQVLPHMAPFEPGGRRLSVLVLDNARIHRTHELEDMCAEAGVRLEFLPPYCPDFNPIEASFHGIDSTSESGFDGPHAC
jgi:hypothetical protein